MNEMQLEIDIQDLANDDIKAACNWMEKIYADGFYPKLTINRPWSKYNPLITGEFARPKAYRWYLFRELRRLATKGAQIKVEAFRRKLALNDPKLLKNINENTWDFNQKKLFLFQPERTEISLDRLKHYTSTEAADFQCHILLTNYNMHMEVFKKRFPDSVGSASDVQMPTLHHKLPDHKGVSIVNIGVGPSNAKTCTDHLATLRPDLMIMVGHCGGLRNHQSIGDFVLASGYMRADQVLDEVIPPNVPVIPTFLLNVYLQRALENHDLKYRMGTVYTTANRNWIFSQNPQTDIQLSRSVGIDMESATVAANGFRYRIPNATLLCVSDKPFHGKPKLSNHAQNFYRKSKELHLDIVLEAIDIYRENFPDGNLPTRVV